ncbi:hypothetical protein RTO_24300 [[Ruminococcus] torques L2-14]|uniref:Uncharacterized protein n=1 Tax=[Ruminococcus] torques L2-14 TaxID=657313 RepID=D4M6Q1_9FIRM|nr:hypothetical protein RTO_24300 [[Ruminococcus] torques L2-14]
MIELLVAYSVNSNKNSSGELKGECKCG